MLLAAAVCPCPPLLVPEVASGAASELDGARAACARAIEALAAARPDRLLVVGPARVAEGGHVAYPTGTRGTFRGFGVDLAVRLGVPSSDLKLEVPSSNRRPGMPSSEPAARPAGAEPAAPVLPPSLAVAAWLLGHARWPAYVPVAGVGVPERLSAARCGELGAELAAGPERVALLAMGDASASRTVKAPGYLDERAADFDAQVGRALATVDLAVLGALDEQVAREVKAAGRAAWQVLAGAAEGADLRGSLLHDDAPYGVGYLVATWT